MLDEIETITNRNISNQYKAIVLVPSSGCTGCINGAEDFLVNKYLEKGKNGLFFIVSGHRSIKEAKLRLGQSVVARDVYLDLDKYFNRDPFLKGYPQVLFIKDGELTSVEEITPEASEGIYRRLLTLAY
ncbi:hypothetical protein KK083_19745 [Fulvivirgaceae bacterium PWU4]|uniref:Uncharacterized protein n=1 Tax=Chryseosolibacter histidini TaxID=2782349 RepID=A0AAP2DPE8_9BACT|nr:hypothetical protein [Chryseosolibacter histidini]MBT1699139.1 hypothetical protein [Chryseosolibacter histidini]